MPITPSASENIPSVNTYRIVFPTSHIYKSDTSSHSKPELFWTTTLTLLLPPVRECLRKKLSNQVFDRFPSWPLLPSWFMQVRAPESRTGSSSDSRIGSSPKFALSTVEIPGFRIFVTPLTCRIKIPEPCISANSGLHRFQASENREFPAPEKHALRTSLSSRFEGDGFS
jgi:hypothetical protein